jgi:TldD protein
VRVDAYDATVGAALDAARALGLYAIVRVQSQAERRVTVAAGAVERQRTNRLSGVGIHVFAADGSVGFASTDDVRPAAVVASVRHAGRLATAMQALDAARTGVPFALQGTGRTRLERQYQSLKAFDEAGQLAGLVDAQAALAAQAPALQLRTSLHIVDDEWRIARSDGTDVSFSTPRASLRHELTGHIGESVVRASAGVSGTDGATLLAPSRLAVLKQRAQLAARQAAEVDGAPVPPSGPCRVILDYAMAKGLAHEAIGHLCESDVDGSILMRRGRLRLGEQLARATVSVVDGPLAGDYADQPISANGVERETVAIVEEGVLAAGLGDLFSAEQAGMRATGACRAASFRDRPTPRMTNIRLMVTNPLALAGDPEDLTPEAVATTLHQLGITDQGVPTVYLTGYRGGQAHPRRGDFIFAAGAVYEIVGDRAEPRRAASFSGLAERALGAIVAGIGPLRLDAMGLCGKDGSTVPSSGGSHALLVLDPDPALAVSAAS